MLLFCLLGQFLLAPAMALPDQLHLLGQHHLQQLEEHLQQAVTQTDREPSLARGELSLNDMSAASKDLSLYNLVADIGEQVSTTLCEASCQMLSTGQCTNHSSCAPGLGSMCVLLLKQNISQEQIDGPSWSVKTVKLHVVTPPPNA